MNNEKEFKVGDIVEAFGVRGVVVEGVKESFLLPIFVRFDSGLHNSFTWDGRYDSWHKEPSLKLIERPKKRVKKRVYVAVSKNLLKTSNAYLSKNECLCSIGESEDYEIIEAEIEVEDEN